jgi:hypothetical protein
MTLFKLIRRKIADNGSIYTRTIVKVAVSVICLRSGMVALDIRGLRGSEECCGIDLAETLNILAAAIGEQFAILIFEDGVLYNKVVRLCDRFDSVEVLTL